GRLPHRAVEALALRAVGLVRDRGTNHPEGYGLAVHGHLELGLQRGELLRVLAREAAHVALAGEAPELADAPVSVDGRPEPLRSLALSQLRVALEARLERVPVHQPRPADAGRRDAHGEEAR